MANQVIAQGTSGYEWLVHIYRGPRALGGPVSALNTYQLPNYDQPVLIAHEYACKRAGADLLLAEG